MIYQRFLDTIVHEYDEIFTCIQDIADQKSLENSVGESIDYYGEFLNVDRMYNETDVDYINRLLTYISSIKQSTTKDAIQQFIANFLNIEISDVVIFETTPYYLSIMLPSENADDAENLKKYIYQIIAAGIYVHFEFTDSVWDLATWDTDDYKWG